MRWYLPGPTRASFLWSGCAVLIVNLLACAPPLQPPVPVSPLVRLNTQLVRSLTEYRAEPETLRDIANLEGWDAGESGSRANCKMGLCPGGNGPVQIDAVKRLRTYNHNYDAGPHGTVVARVWSPGRLTGDTNFVYVVVRRWGWDTSKGLHFAHAHFVEVALEQGQSRLVEIRDGEYRECPLHPQGVVPNAARFGGCTHLNQPHRDWTKASLKGGPSQSEIPMRLEDSGAGQTHCGAGCCEVGGT
jgi:hypothetical protein